MASIQRRGAGWSVRWRDATGRQRSRQCPDHATAKKIQREIDRAGAEGREWEGAAPRVERLSVAELFARYLAERRHVLRASSVRRTQYRLVAFVAWYEGRHGIAAPARHMSRRCLGEYLDQMVADGVSEATRWRRVRVVEQVWRWLAQTEEYRDHLPPASRLDMASPAVRPTIAPTWAQMDQCIAAAGPECRRLAVLLRFTGLRLGQVRRLVWADFDLEGATLTVRPELGKTRHEARGRVMPISPHLVEEMSTWTRTDGPVAACGRNVLRRTWRRSGVPESVWGSPGPGRAGQPAHIFRKGFASGLRALGADPDSVEALLGHARGLVGVYVDPASLPLRETVALIPPLTVPASGSGEGLAEPPAGG